ncbi:MAG: hypothetical protein AAFV01_14005 [Bacteroidota bacterium]
MHDANCSTSNNEALDLSPLYRTQEAAEVILDNFAADTEHDPELPFYFGEDTRPTAKLLAAGANGVKRKNPVRLVRIPHPFVVKSNEGDVPGNEGDFLAHDPISGHYWPVSADYVAIHYELITEPKRVFYTTNDGRKVDYGSGPHAYDIYGSVVGYLNYQGKPMPAFEDLTDTIIEAWMKAAREIARAKEDIHALLSIDDPTAESRSLRAQIDEALKLLKVPVSGRRSRERSLAITKLQEAIMWLGMDLKAQREEGLNTGPNPYPNSYDPQSAAPIASPADGLTM